MLASLVIPAVVGGLLGLIAKGGYDDARSTVAGGASLMAPALGYEAGLRWKPRPDLQRDR